jgi:hypothetical protein
VHVEFPRYCVERVLTKRRLLGNELLWIKPTADLTAGKPPFRKQDAQDWDIEFKELEPRLGAVTELDLSDDDSTRARVEEKAVGLAPASAKRIFENDPRS